MQSVFVIITKLIASKHYFCKEVFCNNFGRDGSFGTDGSCSPAAKSLFRRVHSPSCFTAELLKEGASNPTARAAWQEVSHLHCELLSA